MENVDIVNQFGDRLDDLAIAIRRRRLDVLMVFGEANIRSLTGLACDNGCLLIFPWDQVRDEISRSPIFVTDFRYIPMAHRVAPWLHIEEQCKGDTLVGAAQKFLKRSKIRVARIGFEGSIPTSRYLLLQQLFKRAEFVECESEVLDLRAVKTVKEIMKIATAELRNDEIWRLACREIKPGMTEKQIQRIIRAYMNELGDGEAFETIVCAGANAAECHHVPDDTVWQKGEPLLVDMGVKVDGVCSDMTRCIKPGKAPAKAKLACTAEEYAKIYDIVLKANLAGIAAARPGITGAELDKVARDIITEAGYGEAFGHSLGHGVGYEIHEAPTASVKGKTKLKAGMLVTIEPGIYLEGKLGVRIEDLVLITTTGCEVLSHSKK